MQNNMALQMNADQRATSQRSRQPIEAANNPSSWLTIGTVQAITGMSRTKIYNELKAGTFVEPIRRGARCTRWRAGDVTAWMDAQ